MTIRQIYQFAIQKGMEVDIRGKEEIEKLLKELKEEYEGLSEEEKALFDTERLTNPFGDTRIVCGDETREVHRMMVGIDISGQEILAAEALRREGKQIDLIFAHHTSGLGKAHAAPKDFMQVQVYMMARAGVPIHIAEKVVEADIAKYSRGEDYRNIALAQLFDIPIIAIHTPADNYGLYWTEKLVAENNPAKVKDLLDLLKSIPEYQALMKEGIAPRAIVGSPNASLGKIYYCLTGGYNPSPLAFQKLAEAGVSTSVMVAASEDHKKIAQDNYMNIIIAPHYPYDSLGLNLLLDDLRRQAPFEIIPCSNFTRVER